MSTCKDYTKSGGASRLAVPVSQRDLPIRRGATVGRALAVSHR